MKNKELELTVLEYLITYPKIKREFISRMVLHQACKYIHVTLTSDFHMHAAVYLLLYSFMYLFLGNCLLLDLHTLFEKIITA